MMKSCKVPTQTAQPNPCLSPDLALKQNHSPAQALPHKSRARNQAPRQTPNPALLTQMAQHLQAPLHLAPHQPPVRPRHLLDPKARPHRLIQHPAQGPCPVSVAAQCTDDTTSLIARGSDSLPTRLTT